jgi:hypothetical protein
MGKPLKFIFYIGHLRTVFFVFNNTFCIETKKIKKEVKKKIEGSPDPPTYKGERRKEICSRY